jgi:molybdopterin molybdotransferase
MRHRISLCPDVVSLLNVDEAQGRVLEHAQPLQTETVAIDRAAGRVTAADVRAQVDLPPFASSAMDGFAVRAADTPGTLAVGERIAAGRPAPRPLEPGEAFAISTGGVVPDGADAVVPIEYVVVRDNEVEIPDAVVSLANVRPRGGDIAAGDVVVRAGVRLAAQQIGALAAAGVAELECTRSPRVAVVATGTELRVPGAELRPGEVYEANGVLLAAALTACGAEVVSLPSVEDDVDAHRRVLAGGLEHDVLVTSGGVSVGEHDLVRTIEQELGVNEVFWGVAVKPGKPVAFGVRGRTLVFGLPGNPVSALVGCELFVKPAVRALQGLDDPLPALAHGRLGREVRRNADRDEYLRATSRVEDATVVLEPVTGQESHMIARAASADALVLVPRGEGTVAAGTTVAFLRL